MTPTRAIIPHRLIPGVTGVSGDAFNLSVTNNNAGGFGTAEWDTYADPGLAVHDAVAIDLEGRTFEGKVASVTSGVGEKLTYHVACVGHYDELKEDETVHGVFVDRDISMWQAADCDNWGVAPDFQISLDAAASLSFAWPAVDKTMCYQSETQTHYYAHIGNALPHFDVSDFPAADALWTAAYYRLPGNKTITGLAFEASYYMLYDGLNQMMTPDYTSPIGPKDERYGHRFSRYPNIGYWSDFYGLWADRSNHLKGVKTPNPMYLGVYLCNDPVELPTQDPVAMRNDPHLLHCIDGGICGLSWMNDKLPLSLAFYGLSGKLLVFYAAYLPVRLPFNLEVKYSKNADHLVRTAWVARNRLYNPFSGVESNRVDVKNISVYSRGYESRAGGSDDLADVFKIMFPAAVVESMPLPAPLDDTAPTSIVLRTPTTKLAAIPELLSLYPVDMCWGLWEDKVLTIERDAGSVSVGDEPGVDTTGAALSDEGAVDIVLVEYTPAPWGTPRLGELQIARTYFLTVDLDGNMSPASDGWVPAAGVRAAYVDATGSAHSEEAAIRIGQAVAISRRPGQWTGSVSLHAIAGASLIRPGKTLSAPGITGALITQTTVSVDGDQVTLQLGNTGYIGRFAARVAGKPLTASPNPRTGVVGPQGRYSGKR